MSVGKGWMEWEGGGGSSLRVWIKREGVDYRFKEGG